MKRVLAAAAVVIALGFGATACEDDTGGTVHLPTPSGPTTAPQPFTPATTAGP